MPPLVGFLLVGVLIGPHGARLVPDAAGVWLRLVVGLGAMTALVSGGRLVVRWTLDRIVETRDRPVPCAAVTRYRSKALRGRSTCLPCASIQLQDEVHDYVVGQRHASGVELVGGIGGGVDGAEDGRNETVSETRVWPRVEHQPQLVRRPCLYRHPCRPQ